MPASPGILTGHNIRGRFVKRYLAPNKLRELLEMLRERK